MLLALGTQKPQKKVNVGSTMVEVDDARFAPGERTEVFI